MSRIVRRLVLGAVACATLGWFGYTYLISNDVANNAAARTLADLEKQWASGAETKNPPAAIEDGEAFAIIRVPRFGADWAWPVFAGTRAVDKGPAWYSVTSQPGQPGNFAVAAHRVTHGAPFARLLDLVVGDTITVETRSAVFTYRIVVPAAQLTVDADAGWVLDPVPGKPDVLPWEPIVTLTTAQDLFVSSDRSVAFGVLDKKEDT